MKVDVETYGQSALFVLKGDLNADSLDTFRRAVDSRLADGDTRDLVLDLAEVPFVDSAALEYLLDLQERLSERLGQVKLARPDENVRKIFEITRLDNAFEGYEDVSKAIRTL